MIPGISGQLLSHAYLEQQLLPTLDRGASQAFERRASGWWRAVSRSIGPS